MTSTPPPLPPLRDGATPYDVVVVGGGPAGLSAAVALGRARRTVLVVDAGQPRNATAGHLHNYLGREGDVPAALLATGREEVQRYGGQVLAGRVTALAPGHGAGEGEPGVPVGFRVGLDDGRTVTARRLVLATGLHDELPPVPGLAERWGRDVLHCPYCHGYEVRDEPIGVLGSGPMAAHQALLFRQWSADLVLFTHTAPPLTGEQREQLEARGVQIVDGEVAGLVVSNDQLTGVRLGTGEVIGRRALVVAPRFTAAMAVPSLLGLEPTVLAVGGQALGSYLEVDANGLTTVPGVYAAGNLVDLRGQLITSAAAGLNVGAAVNADLIAEETAAAVAAHRARTGVAA